MRRRAGAVGQEREALEGRSRCLFDDERFATGEQKRGLFARGENELGVTRGLIGAGDCERARCGIDTEELVGAGGGAERGTEAGGDSGEVSDRGPGSHEHDRARGVEASGEGECALGEAGRAAGD